MAEHLLDKYKSNKKTMLFRIFIFAIIEFLCLISFFVISGITGSLSWPIERLITTPEGFLIQLLNLIALIIGFVLAVHIVIYLALVFKS